LIIYWSGAEKLGLRFVAFNINRQAWIDKTARAARGMWELCCAALCTPHVLNRLKSVVRPTLALTRLADTLDRQHGATPARTQTADSLAFVNEHFNNPADNRLPHVEPRKVVNASARVK